MRRWEFKEAADKLEEVVSLALSQEPQLVVRDGAPMVYVISFAEYERWSAQDETSGVKSDSVSDSK